jgi:hypothetical protein
MPYYKVKKIYKSVVFVEVCATTKSEAIELCMNDFRLETDCYLYDMEVVETEGEN